MKVRLLKRKCRTEYAHFRWFRFRHIRYRKKTEIRHADFFRRQVVAVYDMKDGNYREFFALEKDDWDDNFLTTQIFRWGFFEEDYLHIRKINFWYYDVKSPF